MAANNARGQSNVRLVAISVGILAGLLGVTTAVIIGTRDDQGNVIEGELQPDGKTRCVKRNFNCTAFTPPSSQFRPDGGPPYVNLVLTGQECLADDGGTYFNVPEPQNELVFEPMLCQVKEGVATGPVQNEAIGTEPERCACRGGPACFDVLLDGGQGEPLPYGETVFPGRFTGSDCVPKACGEIAGISSWPDECPTLRDGGFAL